MPAKNIVKIYVAGGYYHAYSRGVEKRIIFMDSQDYRVFLGYLKEALSPPLEPENLAKAISFKGRTFKGIPRQPKNFMAEIDLIAFCLMPNHFHLLLRQTNDRSMKSFLQAILTRYTMYFNKRHTRVGSLFQSRYKASFVDSEEYLLYLSRYIHRNPIQINKSIRNSYSSYKSYLKMQKLSWVKSDIVLSFFERRTIPTIQKINSYEAFVEQFEHDDIHLLGDQLALDAPREGSDL